jgi:hypothetical protein
MDMTSVPPALGPVGVASALLSTVGADGKNDEKQADVNNRISSKPHKGVYLIGMVMCMVALLAGATGQNRD